MISATVTGTVGKDAELKKAGQTDVLEFSVASRRWAKDGEQTDWIRVSMFGQRAAKLVEHVKKGGKVACRGTLHGRAYAGKDGPAVSLELKAEDVELLGGKQDAQPFAAPSKRAQSMLDAYSGDSEEIPF
jgi:single-strand DNA-binding protein